MWMKKYNVEKTEKNEYPKWKFIDPSGGEGGSEGFYTHFLIALFASALHQLFMFTHNINCNEMRKAYEPAENIMRIKYTQCCLCVYNNNYRNCVNDISCFIRLLYVRIILHTHRFSFAVDWRFAFSRIFNKQCVWMFDVGYHEHGRKNWCD